MQEEVNKSEIAKKEEKVLKFWKDNSIFEKTLAKKSKKGEFIFYEGPPTANGKPGVHHMITRAFKDIIPRFKTMQGYHVRRKGGWDTHGLPVELQVEKELGLKSKKEIESFGVAEFNKKCKESVWTYVDLWEKFSERVAYWVDQKDPFITYTPNYMESLWHIVKEVDKQNLLFKDYKVVPWCPRCGTGLSSHELAQGYEDVKDLSVYVKFKVKNPEKIGLSGDVFLLAWTTTPWTLPGNVGLAVKDDVDYVRFYRKSEPGVFYIVSLSYFKNKSPSNVNVTDTKDPLTDIDWNFDKAYKGRDLLGLEYEPLFPYLKDLIPESEKPKLQNAYKVYSADFVTTEDGTGIVHTAVMYGQDDFELGTKVNLPKMHLVDETGHFVKGTGEFEGLPVKEKQDNGLKTAIEVLRYLQEKGLFFHKENYSHSYPHCWRCKTPLIYYARDSWYIRMSQLRDKLIKENNTVNWQPAHIKDGRVGEWLREVKDWAISRERYWGTPLPVWESLDKTEREVIGSIADLKKLSKKSGNSYTIMRHGHQHNNTTGRINSIPNQPNDYQLSDKGKEQVEKTAKQLQKKKIDLIFASDFERTAETAKIVASSIGLSEENVILDVRLREINTGDFEGKTWEEYHDYFKNPEDRYKDAPKGGESVLEVKKRVGDFIFEIDKKYHDKNILVVSHGLTLYLFECVTFGKDMHSIMRKETENERYKTAEARALDFWQLPHDDEYDLDLHKPYIDNVVLEKNGKELFRTKEVMDVWFDSGSMPFAQDHYPFENKKWVDGEGYPADYISEAIDQTRGWFYTLLAVGVLMGKGVPYKNVICLGHILDSEGKKMSKSLGNVIDPWTMMDKYGADAMRFWMYSINQPGDTKNFDEKTVDEIVKKVFNLYANTLSFYNLYKQETSKNPEKSKNVLDKWILTLLSELIENITKGLESYNVIDPARSIRDFIGELSQWYLRRSRDRFKTEGEDKEYASATLRHVLFELSKLMAPFTPFVAEEMYQELKGSKDPESVHLAEWPQFESLTKKHLEILDYMKTTRKIVSETLEERAKNKINVRQPLSTLDIDESADFPEEYLKLIRDEVNVKQTRITKSLKYVVLNTDVTAELKKEGDYRDFVRVVQDLRKTHNLQPQDLVTLTIPNEFKEVVTMFEAEFKKTVGAKEIKFGGIAVVIEN